MHFCDLRRGQHVMKAFLLGVNYWASHAGVDMWRDWREDVVEQDLAFLAENGVNVIRVFPNWRDFQSVEPLYGGNHRLREYRMTGDRLPENPWYLEEAMLQRFASLCRIAQDHKIKLIVGLITGWMSGRLFIPPALYEKNLFTDPVALYFQQLFIKGFVQRFRGENCILAWDLGNECNCMDQAPSREAAYSWTSTIVNAVRAYDQSRYVVSGMHSLELDGTWNIQDQAELTDVLTTHPYPFWVEHCQLTPLNSFRTLLHATAQTCYYSTVGGRPCLVEELGSMGPMNCEEALAADFLKTNLWSNWAHGAPGVLWWCAFDQTHLERPPYDWNMCERELGMADISRNPKSSLLQLKAFGQTLQQLNLDLPKVKQEGVCILSWGQDHWGTAYMSFLLAKQAGLTLRFAYCDQKLPDSDLYFLPSVHTDNMSRKSYMELKEKVAAGATLYISVRDGIFTEFEEFTGLQVITAAKSGKRGLMQWEGETLPYQSPHRFQLKANRAKVLASEEDGNPIFSVASYGKGTVYFLNFPLEEMLLTEECGFEEAYYRLYETVASHTLGHREIQKRNPSVGMTLHEGKDETYAVFINYTDSHQNADTQFARAPEIVYGDYRNLEPFGAAIVKFKMQSKEETTR